MMREVFIKKTAVQNDRAFTLQDNVDAFLFIFIVIFIVVRLRIKKIYGRMNRNSLKSTFPGAL